MKGGFLLFSFIIFWSNKIKNFLFISCFWKTIVLSNQIKFSSVCCRASQPAICLPRHIGERRSNEPWGKEDDFTGKVAVTLWWSWSSVRRLWGRSGRRTNKWQTTYGSNFYASKNCPAACRTLFRNLREYTLYLTIIIKHFSY